MYVLHYMWYNTSMWYITFSSAAGLVYPGAWSDSQQIKVQRDCHLLQPVILQHSRKMALNLNAGVIAGEQETYNDYFRCDNIQNSSTNRHKILAESIHLLTINSRSREVTFKNH